MRYFKIGDTFKFAREDGKRRAETNERNFNSHQTMDLLFLQKKQCMFTGFILPFAQYYWICLLITEI